MLGNTVTFFSDGTVSIMNSFGGTYEIKDKKLVINAGDGAL